MGALGETRLFVYIQFEQMAAWLAVHCSKTAVKEHMRISWNTVGPIVERVEQDLDIDPASRFDNLKRIGVDETSYHKGQKYITTLVNQDTGNVIWVCKRYRKKFFSKFFRQLT